MYHVTNVSADTSPKHPDWRTIEPNVANDTVYSGSLLGLPVAFFTTTLYKNKLPNRSPYPKGTTTGIKHWRVTIPFDYRKFNLFLMNERKTDESGVTQIHLLCLNEHNSKAEKLLTTSLTHEEKLIDGTRLNRYFPYGKENVYTKADRMFVNISFINPVLVNENAKWDTVPKDDSGFGNIIADPPFDTLYEWGMDKLKSTCLQQEWEALHKEGKLSQDTPMNTI